MFECVVCYQVLHVVSAKFTIRIVPPGDVDHRRTNINTEASHRLQQIEEDAGARTYLDHRGACRNKECKRPRQLIVVIPIRFDPAIAHWRYRVEVIKQEGSIRRLA